MITSFFKNKESQSNYRIFLYCGCNLGIYPHLTGAFLSFSTFLADKYQNKVTKNRSLGRFYRIKNLEWVQKVDPNMLSQK